jgi:hypothetical protein
MNDPQSESRHVTDCVLVERTCDDGHPLIKFYDQIYQHDDIDSNRLSTMQSACPLCQLRRDVVEALTDQEHRIETLEKACAGLIAKWREDERQTREAQAMLVAPEEGEA